MEFFRSTAETVTRDRMVTLGLVSGNSSGHAARTSLSRSNNGAAAPRGCGVEGSGTKKKHLSLSESL
jgi:hypothetical protein